VEVAEGQELEVLPKNEEEEKEEILLTEAISTTPKRPKAAKIKSSVRSQHNEKTLADISEQLQKQNAKIDKVGQMLQPLQKYLKSAKKETELIKELQIHIKQLQKQLSQINKGIRTTQSNKKWKNKK
jgi:septal ring factor EnvC (AmiA/AmiB activator)